MVEFVGYGKISHPKKPFQNYANIIHDYLFQKTCIPEMHFQNDVNIILEMFFHTCFFFFFFCILRIQLFGKYMQIRKKKYPLCRTYIQTTLSAPLECVNKGEMRKNV